jgi:hypothetical protein
MAKPDTSRIDTLEAIMADKRKHESYLAKLEERRASTPASVFNRLRDEYLTKLTDLQVRASMEAESLSEGLKAEETAVAEIESRLAAITDERIEGELRAEVGEYDPKEWAKKLESLSATIAQIEKERTSKVASYERTRRLLTEARGAATPAVVPPPMESPSAPPPAAAPAPVLMPVPASPAPAPAHIVEAASAPVAAAVPVAAPPAAPAPPKAAEAAPTRQTPLGQPVPAAPAAVAPVAAAAPAPAAPVVEPSREPASEPAAAPAPEPRSSAPASDPVPAPTPERAKTPAPGAPMAGSPSFDELAFLNSVVGRTSTSAKAEPAAPSSPEPRPSGASRAVPVPPPAAPAPRATTNVRPPLDDESAGPLGRPTPRTSQAIKTLKCQECGTLNFPTEWYCERCGGELAAL